MTNNQSFAERLKAFGANIERWRTEEARLRVLSNEALASRQVEEKMLVKVERSAGVLYREIEAFHALVGEIARESPAAAAELAPVEDAIRLLLLDVTELGTRLYSIRSMDVVEADPSGVFAIDAS